MDSMTQLAALLEDHDMVDERELGELYREMGQSHRLSGRSMSPMLIGHFMGALNILKSNEI